MTAEAVESDHHIAWPYWLRELDRMLPVYPQFLITGNIRDLFLTPGSREPELQGIVPSIRKLLAGRGAEFFLIYDGFEIRFEPDRARDVVSRLFPRRWQLSARDNSDVHRSVSVQVEPRDLPWWVATVAGVAYSHTLAENVRQRAAASPCALIVEFASRLIVRPGHPTAGEHCLFAKCEKIARATQALRQSFPYNPILWLADRPSDLPDWFVVGNEVLRTLTVGPPDWDTRMEAARTLARSLPDHEALGLGEQESYVRQFADSTDGSTLRAMGAIAALARLQGAGLAGIVDAVRSYKVGVPDNPWKQSYLREKLRDGDLRLRNRVKGQNRAIRKTLDILCRAVTGLSGAQSVKRGSRPRGILFFAGPTGVGKTELAKSIAELIFGDEQAYKRFDMSEFSAEHSDARLIGAPPGYVGYDSGGELVNAIRQRPFSVLLFDEIEKAHPRILDKFLQVLEDGRLTDGRGRTVFFSEALIIFTSNLGMFESIAGERKPVFDPSRPPRYEELEKRVRGAISDHFRFVLERPELLNRIGDNIVVFDFIRPQVAREIFERMVANVLEHTRSECGIVLTLSEEARRTLYEECTKDLGLGGRGIGNRLETMFINPLARAVFGMTAKPGDAYRVDRIAERDGLFTLEIKYDGDHPA